MSRWASGLSKDCVSCWPCRSTSRAPSWARTLTVVGLPLTQARERPSAVISRDRKSTRLNSSHSQISYAVFCLKKKKILQNQQKSEQRTADDARLSRRG